MVKDDILEKIKKIKKSDHDSLRESRSKGRIESSRELFYQNQYNLNVEQRKALKSSKNDIVSDFESLNEHEMLSEYLDVIKYILVNGFSISNIKLFDNDFEIQLISEQENKIFELNKYELMYLYFVIAVSNDEVQIIKTEKMEIKLDKHTTMKVNGFSDNKFRCVVSGLNDDKQIDIDVRELIRLKFFEQEYIIHENMIPQNYKNISLYQIIFTHRFRFMYTLFELLDVDVKLPIEVNMSSYKKIEHKELLNTVDCSEVFDVDKLYENTTLNVDKDEYFKLLNNDVRVYEEEIIKKMYENKIGYYLKENTC